MKRGQLLRRIGKKEEPFDPTYIIEIDTEQSGVSNSDQFQFTGAIGEYDVDAVQSGTVVASFTELENQETITLPSAGVYHLHIKLDGSNFFDKFTFNNSGDRLKLLKTIKWGDYGVNVTSQDSAFDGCNNHIEIPENGKWFDVLTNGSNMFFNNSLSSLPEGMELPLLTNASQMFRNNLLASLPSSMKLPLLTNSNFMFANNLISSLPEGMELPLLTNGRFMFQANQLSSLPAGMKLPSLTDGFRIFQGSTIDTARYSQLLIDLEAENNNNNVTFHGGSSKYNIDGETARNALIARGWDIIDRGLE